MIAQQFRTTVECDSATSFWLKEAFCSLSARDPADALHDAEVLVAYCLLRLEEMKKAGGEA